VVRKSSSGRNRGEEEGRRRKGEEDEAYKT
jgi:hypothetical protein